MSLLIGGRKPSLIVDELDLYRVAPPIARG